MTGAVAGDVANDAADEIAGEVAAAPEPGRPDGSTRSRRPTGSRVSGLTAPVSVALVVGALWAPVFRRLVEGTATSLGANDFRLHIDLARDFDSFDLPAPHPVFHASVRMLGALWDVTTSAVVVMTLAVTATAAALVVLARRGWGGRAPLGDVGASAFALYVILAEPPELILRAVGLLPPGTLAPTTHAWGSPTDTLMLPLLVLLLIHLVDLFDDVDLDPLGPRRGVGLATIVIALTLTKPTFSIVMVAGLPLFLLVSGRWRSQIARAGVAWVLLPVVAVTAWQVWIASTGRMGPEAVGIRVAPFEAVRLLGLLDVGPAFWVSHFAVLAVAVIGGRRYFRDLGIMLAGSCWIVAMVPLVLLQETGPSSTHGNVSKPAGVAWFVLHLFTVRFVALEVRDAWQRRATDRVRLPRWSVPLAAMVLLSVLSGVWVYLDTAVLG